MPSSTFTLTKDVPAALADQYAIASNTRTAGSVITIDHELGLALIRLGYAQAGVYAAPAGGVHTNSKQRVLLTGNVPTALADSLGLAAGAGRSAGTTVSVWPDQASQLIRGGYGSFADEVGGQSLGKKKDLIGSATLDFPSIAGAGSAELTVPVAGASVGDPVAVGAPAGINTGLIVNGRVTAAGVVTVRVTNVTGAAIDPVSAQWKVAVIKF